MNQHATDMEEAALSQNEQAILITGQSASGKSASLRTLRNQSRWMYLNCEAGKRLPFRNQFDTYNISDPMLVPDAFDAVTGSPDYDGLIIDTFTMLMEMYEDLYVRPADDTRTAWGEYAAYIRYLMQQKVNKCDKPVLILGHLVEVYDEKQMEMSYRCGVKGAVGKGNGFESMFSTVVTAKKISLEELKQYSINPELLHISEEDQELEYKHCFQVRPTKATKNERIRSPMDMFPRTEPFMDNDAQLLLDHLNDYYS